jgi:hypothetical protein
VRHAHELTGLSRYLAGRALEILAAETAAVTVVSTPNGHHTPPLESTHHGHI